MQYNVTITTFLKPLYQEVCEFMCINMVSIIGHNTWNTTIDIIGLKKKMNSREICPKKKPVENVICLLNTHDQN